MVDDGVQDGGDEDLLAPPGPRRSTFTPPPRDPSSIEHAARVFNDDEIAAALAEQLNRPAPAAAPSAQPEQVWSLDQPASTPVSSAADAVKEEDDYGDEAGFQAPVEATPPASIDPKAFLYLGAPPPTVPALDAPPPPGYEAPPAEVQAYQEPPTEPPAYEEPPVDAPSYQEPPIEPPPYQAPPSDFTPVEVPVADLPTFPPPSMPQEDESQTRFTAAVAGDDSDGSAADAGTPAAPARPERQSLADDELLLTLQSAADNPGATLDVIEQLQNQLLLREGEAQAFRDWESSMLALGTPDALAAVEEARSGFADLVSQSQPLAHPQTQDQPELRDDAEAGPQTEPEVPAWPDEPAAMQQADHPLSPPALVEPPQSFASYPEMPAPLDEIGRFDVTPGQDSAATVAGSPPSEPVPFGTPPSEPVPFAAPSFDDALLTGTSSPFDIEAFLSPSETGEGDESSVGPGNDAGPNPVAAPQAPASQPVPIVTARAPRAFLPEETGAEPTPADQRVGRAARMFWMWFAANSSLVSVAFGAIVLSLGMSLRQAIVSVLAGVAISFIPLGLGTLAGKRSGQPTMIVSRATFGIVGNVLPALVALISRLFWGAALLWILGAGVASILVGAQLTGGFTSPQLTLIAMAGGFLLALVIAFFGYGMIARVQLVVSIVSGILIVGFIALTASYVDIPAALTIGDGSWLLAITGAVLVFSFVGLVWANSSADLARYQRPTSSGGGSMLWATFGAGVPSFILIAYGALLAASNSQIASALLIDPLDTLGLMLPTWYPIPLLIGTAFSLISGVVISIYSAGFALQAVGLRVHRDVAAVLVGVILAAIAAGLMIMGVDFSTLFRDFATTLAVPVAAWAGIFASEIMIRNRRFEARSLLARGGVYANIRWVNFIMLLVISAIGCGLISASVSWLGWQGYLFPLLGIPLTSELAATDLGVIVALALGLLTPIVAGIPAIRRQEKATAPAE